MSPYLGKLPCLLIVSWLKLGAPCKGLYRGYLGFRVAVALFREKAIFAHCVLAAGGFRV